MKCKDFKIMKILVVVMLLCLMPLQAFAAQTVVKDMPLSSGVNYKQYTYTNTKINSINHLAINLSNAYTKLNIGLPNTTSGKERTTSIATRDSVEGNRVVGAVNAAFFDMKEGFPLFLISQQNEILNGGVLLDSRAEFFNQPIAFGVTADGNAEIDLYDFDIKMRYNNLSYELSGMNRERRANEAIVFTPQNWNSTTNSNEFGMEVVFESATTIDSNYYGQQISGKVKHIRPSGSKEIVQIPKNGFVLSVHGADWMAVAAKMKVGEEVTIDFNIDSKWVDSQFMLASGPMLVKDGKRYITMDTTSSRAKEVAPRSAIAISKDKKTVHFITVDGRLANFSTGMNMTQFADYLVSLGFDRAINLDGGGSTTMGIRNYGSNKVVLANKPSDVYERSVSAILEAISTAPTGDPSIINFTRSNVGTMLVGASSSFTVNYILDAHYNPITIDPTKFNNKSDNSLVSFNGNTFTALKAGSDRVRINYGTAYQSFPINIVAEPAKLNVTPTSNSVSPGGKITFKATALDAAGKGLIYSPSQLKWSVEGNIGTITSTGGFTAGAKSGKGKVVAQLGTKKVSVDVEVKEKLTTPFTDIATTNPYIKEINYLTSNKYITGYEDGTFKPDNNLTRAHAAVLISRAKKLDLDNVTNPNFSDVPTSHPYYKEIAAVANAGIVSGKGSNSYDPNGKLTRAQMAKIFVKAYGLTGTSPTTFTDVPSDYWAVKEINTLTASGITTGFGDGTYRPNTPITRLHFSVFLYRAIQ